MSATAHSLTDIPWTNLRLRLGDLHSITTLLRVRVRVVPVYCGAGVLCCLRFGLPLWVADLPLCCLYP